MPVLDSERYEIDPVAIGHGGFGDTYTARDLLLDREVVIKIISSTRTLGIDEPTLRHNFFKEALVAARLGQKTKHIVKVLDYGYDRDASLPFFVMEKIDGGDLYARIGTFTWLDAARLLDNLLRALSVAHEHGVVHSDISPDNILYDARDKAYKLIDFGLSKIIDSVLISRRASMSMTGGKQGYLPFEEWHAGIRTPFSDLYGVAITLIHLITGKVPVWSFDFKTNQMTGPDVHAVLDTGGNDQVLINGGEDCIYSARNPDSDRWHHKSSGYSQVTQWVTFRQSDLVKVIAGILNRDITSVDEAIAACREGSMGGLLEAERTFVKQKAAAEKAATEKAATEKAAAKKVAAEKVAAARFARAALVHESARQRKT